MGKVITLEGRNTILDALSAGKKFLQLFIAGESIKDPKVAEIIRLAKSKKTAYEILSSKQIRNLSGSYNAQNILAKVEIDTPSLKEILDNTFNSKKDPLILLLNHIDYEQNLGAILRSAWGAGVDAVVASPNGVHELTPVVAKVSMGAAVNVPLIAESLFPAIRTLKVYGIPVVGVEAGMGKIYTDLTLRGPIAFVMGGEDAGLSEPLKKDCDIFIHIPMQSALSSLNVSVATALVLFEKLRQESS